MARTKKSPFRKTPNKRVAPDKSTPEENLHPNNPFKRKPPNFRELYEKYPYLKESNEFRVNSESYLTMLKYDYATTKAMMKEYFDLELSLPPDFFIPNIVSVIDVLLWLEETLCANHSTEKSIRVLDIGTGVSCIYPLLGAKVFKWNFVCAKIDPASFDYAVKNVEDNDLTSAVHVLKVNEGCLLSGALAQLEDRNFDFVICNLPEVDGVRTNKNRSKLNEQENQMARNFITQLTDESFEAKELAKMFILNMKRQKKIFRLVKKMIVCHESYKCFHAYKKTFFTVAWTFDESVVFPSDRPKTLSWDVPENIRCLDVYDRTRLCEKLMLLFQGLLIPCEEEEIENDSGDKSFVITAYTDTWSQQKKLKNDEKEKMRSSDQEPCSNIDNRNGQVAEREHKEVNSNFHYESKSKESDVYQQTEAVTPLQNSTVPEEASQPTAGGCQNPSSRLKRKASDTRPNCSTLSDQPEDFEPTTKRIAVECFPIPEQPSEQTCPSPSVPRVGSPMDCSEDFATPCHLIKARLLVGINNDKLRVEMEWISGSSEADLSRIMQFVREYLKYT